VGPLVFRLAAQPLHPLPRSAPFGGSAGGYAPFGRCYKGSAGYRGLRGRAKEKTQIYVTEFLAALPNNFIKRGENGMCINLPDQKGFRHYDSLVKSSERLEHVVFPLDNQNIPYCPGYKLLAYVTNVDVYIFAQKKGNVIKRKMIQGLQPKMQMSVKKSGVIHGIKSSLRLNSKSLTELKKIKVFLRPLLL